jgi:hypothetical protein
MRSFLLLIAFLLPSASWGALLAKVTNVGVSGTGAVFIYFDRDVNTCSDAKNRMDVSFENPALKSVLSIATVAQVSERNVLVNVGGCSNGIGDFTSNGLSYIFLTP